MFRDLISSEACPPLLFRGVIDAWPALQWTPQYLACALRGHTFQCKVSSTHPEDVQWETECLHLKLSLSQYCEWLTDAVSEGNPLQHFDRTKYSCYVDYKYMNEMFRDSAELLKAVQWDVFGCEGRDGSDSTIWIGSTGAYTPCHQDTYGFNLVAQLYGRKRWYLVPPDQTSCMYPTRIPYEESSVFSEVNIRVPDLTRHPNFKRCTPYIIELGPGDVLYVPRHWWHFVECLDSSISVNTWIPKEADVHSHLHEAISRLLFTTLSPVLLGRQDAGQCINTNEELEAVDVSLQYLSTSLENVLDRENEMCQKQILKSCSVNVASIPHSSNKTVTDKGTHMNTSVGCSRLGDKLFDDFVQTFGDFAVKPLEHCVTKIGLSKKRKLSELYSYNEDDANGVLVCDLNTKCGNYQCLNCSGTTTVPDRNKVEIYSCVGMSFKDFIMFLQSHFETSVEEDFEDIMAKLAKDTVGPEMNSNQEVLSTASTGLNNLEKKELFDTVEVDNKSECAITCKDVNSTVSPELNNSGFETSEINVFNHKECNDGSNKETADGSSKRGEQTTEEEGVCSGHKLAGLGALNLTVEDVINSILDPDVVKQIGRSLINKVHTTCLCFCYFLISPKKLFYRVRINKL